MRAPSPANQLWQEVSDKMSQIRDGLGKRIDPGIVETVVALNVLGIPTVASCEGHLEWGCASPWVDVEPAEVATLRTRLRTVQDQEGVQRTSGAPYLPSAAVAQLRQEIKTRQLAARALLLEVLDAFYGDRICCVADPDGHTWNFATNVADFDPTKAPH